MPLKYSIPPGWKQLPLDQSDGMLNIVRGKSGICLTIASGSLLPPEPRDSRHLVWSASRFASVRNLPLQQWATPRQWRAYEADRKHPERDTRVISGASGRLEFEAITFVYDRETAADIYAALDFLFATTTDSSGTRIFAGLTATNCYKKTVALASIGSEWTIGRQTIRIPNGWVPDDTVFPVPPLYLPNALPGMLSIGRIAGAEAANYDLNIQWLPAHLLSQRDGQHKAAGWKLQAEHWAHSGAIALTLQRNVTPLTESFVGSARKSSYSSSGVAFDVHWYYRSKNLALAAFGRSPGLQDCRAHEAALTALIRQLE